MFRGLKTHYLFMQFPCKFWFVIFGSSQVAENLPISYLKFDRDDI